jgi:outer membrane protein assembly factor BamD (BamD/ComL family)
MRIPCCLLVLAAWSAGWVAEARADEEADNELVFISGLVDRGLPDYAQKALDQLLLERPDLAARAKVAQAQILVGRRKFAEAEALAAQLPPDDPRADSIGLAVANGYYMTGDTEKAKTLYDAFFAKYKTPPKDPDLLRFFQEAAYRYAAMMERAGDEEGAAKAYDMILATTKDRALARRLRSEQAVLLVERAAEKEGKQREVLLKRAAKLCEDVLFGGGMDEIYGQTILTLAQSKLATGDQAGAEEVISDYMDVFRSIDKALAESEDGAARSPMAGARYLRGEINMKRGGAAEQKGDRAAAEKLLISAFKDFYNVAQKYPSSDYGAEAYAMAEEVRGRLESDYDKQINIKMPAGLARGPKKIGPKAYELADGLFMQKAWPQAAEAYLVVLNRFPETDQTPRALTNLIKAYAELGDTLSVKMLAGYLTERFAGHHDAGQALLIAAQHYFKVIKDEEMYLYLYDAFLDGYPKHPRSGAVLFSLAGLRKKAGDEEGRMKYLNRLISDYKQDAYFLRAVNALAWERFKVEDYEGAVEMFTLYVAEAQPGPDKAKAQFAMADAYRRQEQYVASAKSYALLISWLEKGSSDNPFYTSAEAKKENQSTLEKALLQRANVWATMPAPEAKVALLRARALQYYDQFLEGYAASDLAPKAMASKGTLLLTLKRNEEASATFEALSKKYPDSEEGKNSLFSLIKAAIESGQVDLAQKAFGDLMANKERYGPSEFLRVGKMMLELESYDQASVAYQQVLDEVENDEVMEKDERRAYIERALFGLGQAAYFKGDYEQASAKLSEMMTRYPRSGYFFNAKFVLAQALRETGRTDEAIDALKGVFAHAKTERLRNEANLELAFIYVKAGDEEKAFQAMQRINVLADPTDPELRDVLRSSLWEGAVLGMKLGHYEDVVENCTKYLEGFPRGDKVEQVRVMRRQARMKASSAVLEPAETP